MSNARVVFDFDGVETNGELKVKKGEEISIINKDIGDGWWEARLINGIEGLVPIAYVEEIASQSIIQNFPSAPDYGSPEHHQQQPERTMSNIYNNRERQGSFDAEWDDFDQYQGHTVAHSNTVSHPVSPGYKFQQPVRNNRSNEQSLSPPFSTVNVGEDGSFTESSRSSSDFTKKSLKKSMNRFSPFVKAGGEAYVLGTTSSTKLPKSSKVVNIKNSSYGPAWMESTEPFIVRVTDPEKKSKFKGMKTYIAYVVTPSNLNQPVERRYKHYDWLHERLMEKFTCLSIPPLPGKQLSGRFNEDFVEKRRELLEMWTNRIARHPVLSQSAVFHHFCTVSEEDQAKWKVGKRDAEKDEFVGPAYFLTVEHDIETMDLAQADVDVECFGRFASVLEEDMGKLRERLYDRARKFEGPFCREYQRFAGNLQAISRCFRRVDQHYSENLTRAFDNTAITYNDIGDLYLEQPKKDLLPLAEGLKEYLSILSTFPDLVHIHKGAVAKVKESEKLKDDGKIGASDVLDVTNRTITISAALQSEILHFQRERCIDFRKMMQNFIREQITFYKNITHSLEQNLAMYDYDENAPRCANV